MLRMLRTKNKGNLMKKTKQFYLLFTFLLLFTLSCSLFSSPPIEPVPNLPEVIPQEELAEEILPTEEPSALLPIGVLTEYEGLLTLFDRDGYTLYQANALGISSADQNNTHIMSPFSAGTTTLPVLYFSFEQNNSLMLSYNDQITTILSSPNFSGLAGAPGKAIIAYTTTEFAGESLVSDLYVSGLEFLPVAEPVLHDEDPQGWAMVALAVEVEDEVPVGVWYSKRPWGIGGDIVFDPRRTLSYLDIRTGRISQFLGTDANPSAISADRKWLAYTNDESAVAGSGSMTIRNVETGVNLSFPLESMVDPRGAGAASFSPNNQYLAWMEGNGWQMAETPNFHSVVRAGDLNGNMVAEFADTAFLSPSGLSVVQRVEPVGWFDDNTLVVMVRGEHWVNDVAVVKVDIATKNISFLAKGAFVGLVYP